MKIIGISGQIGAGKSLLANYLAKKGGVNLEVDEIGHKLLNTDATKTSLVEHFGKLILDEKNNVSRKKLGKIAFENTKNIASLNSVMHPAMVREINEIITNEKKKQSPFILINAALLFSMKLDPLCEKIIFVQASSEVRLARLLKFRNMSKDKAEERLFAQDHLPENNRNVVIVKNNGTKESMYVAVDNVFADIMLKK